MGYRPYLNYTVEDLSLLIIDLEEAISRNNDPSLLKQLAEVENELEEKTWES